MTNTTQGTDELTLSTGAVLKPRQARAPRLLTAAEIGLSTAALDFEGERDDPEPTCSCSHCRARGYCFGCRSGICP